MVQTNSLTHDLSYLITDYERSNFSISQCRFEDNLQENIITIPSTTRLPTHRSHNLIIGASIGAASFLLLLFIAGIVSFRHRQSRVHKPSNSESSNPSKPLDKPNILTVCPLREIGQNSLCGPIRELSDSGKAELLDETSPSGSGNEISEMSDNLPIPTVVHELRTHHSSVEERAIQRLNAKNVYVFTRISQKSWTTIQSRTGTPCVETMISASIRTSTTKEEIYQSYIRKPLNLMRSLPATPISDSPQVSPTVEEFKKDISIREYPNKSKPAIGTFICNPLTWRIPTSQYSMSSSRHHPSLSSSGLEITIPPKRSDTDLSDVSAMSSEGQKLDTTWI